MCPEDVIEIPVHVRRVLDKDQPEPHADGRGSIVNKKMVVNIGEWRDDEDRMRGTEQPMSWRSAGVRFPRDRIQVPTPPQRSESREIAELRRLKQEQPDLASAADLQIELLQLQRRVQSRVSLPSIRLDTDFINAQLASAPVLHFEQLPLEWGDLRFLLRATAAAMRSHEALDDTDFRRIETLCRDADRLPAGHPLVVRVGEDRRAADSSGWRPDSSRCSLQAMRPFLTAIGRRDHGEDRSRRLDARHLPALRRRTGLRRDHAGGRSHPDLRALLGTLALSPADLPVLSERGSRTDHVVRQPRWPVSACTRATSASDI